MEIEVKSHIFFAALGLQCVGCVSLQSVSAGRIGCPAEEIQISNDRQDFGTRNWTAECRGRRFFCNATQTGQHSHSISCTPETPPVDTVQSPIPPNPNQTLAECNPICSPGFACQAGKCIPQCNPICEQGSYCNNMRTCVAASGAK